jgi:hypothetical protein
MKERSRPRRGFLDQSSEDRSVAQLEVFGCRQQRQRVPARELLQLGQRVRAFAIVQL